MPVFGLTLDALRSEEFFEFTRDILLPVALTNSIENTKTYKFKYSKVKGGTTTLETASFTLLGARDKSGAGNMRRCGGCRRVRVLTSEIVSSPLLATVGCAGGGKCHHLSTAAALSATPRLASLFSSLPQQLLAQKKFEAKKVKTEAKRAALAASAGSHHDAHVTMNINTQPSFLEQATSDTVNTDRRIALTMQVLALAAVLFGTQPRSNVIAWASDRVEANKVVIAYRKKQNRKSKKKPTVDGFPPLATPTALSLLPFDQLKTVVAQQPDNATLMSLAIEHGMDEHGRPLSSWMPYMRSINDSLDVSRPELVASARDRINTVFDSASATTTNLVAQSGMGGAVAREQQRAQGLIAQRQKRRAHDARIASPGHSRTSAASSSASSSASASASSSSSAHAVATEEETYLQQMQAALDQSRNVADRSVVQGAAAQSQQEEDNMNHALHESKRQYDLERKLSERRTETQRRSVAANAFARAWATIPSAAPGAAKKVKKKSRWGTVDSHPQRLAPSTSPPPPIRCRRRRRRARPSRSSSSRCSRCSRCSSRCSRSSPRCRRRRRRAAGERCAAVAAAMEVALAVAAASATAAAAVIDAVAAVGGAVAAATVVVAASTTDATNTTDATKKTDATNTTDATATTSTTTVATNPVAAGAAAAVAVDVMAAAVASTARSGCAVVMRTEPRERKARRAGERV